MCICFYSVHGDVRHSVYHNERHDIRLTTRTARYFHEAQLSATTCEGLLCCEGHIVKVCCAKAFVEEVVAKVCTTVLRRSLRGSLQ